MDNLGRTFGEGQSLVGPIKIWSHSLEKVDHYLDKGAQF